MFNSENKMSRKSWYNTILSQVFSPCGKYLVLGDIYGQISVFNLQSIINPGDNVLFPTSGILANERKPKNTFQVQENIQISSLLAMKDFLIVGSLGEIALYNWTNVISKYKDVHPVSKIEMPNPPDMFQKIDINYMIYDDESGVLHAGCSDNKIYAIKIEGGKILHTLNKHTDFIHSIVNHGSNLISGGEDGLVNIWDLRSKQCIHSLEPHEKATLQRPEIGKWIGAVAVTDDWLLCGGGPRLSLWHFRFLSISNVYPIEDRGIHVAHLYKDKVLAGGTCPNFYHMNLNGDVVAVIKTSSVSTYSAVFQTEPYKALCLSGSSPNVDICSNFNYKDQVLTLHSE